MAVNCHYQGLEQFIRFHEHLASYDLHPKLRIPYLGCLDNVDTPWSLLAPDNVVCAGEEHVSGDIFILYSIIGYNCESRKCV